MKIWNQDFKFVELGKNPNLTASSLGAVALLKEALLNGQDALFESDDSGNVPHKLIKTLKEKLTSLNGRTVYDYSADSFTTNISIWEKSIVEFQVSGNYVKVSACSHDGEFISSLRKMIKP